MNTDEHNETTSPPNVPAVLRNVLVARLGEVVGPVHVAPVVARGQVGDAERLVRCGGGAKKTTKKNQEKPRKKGGGGGGGERSST